MKYFAFIAVILSNVQLFAQKHIELNSHDVDGIYLNLNDFVHDDLTRPIDHLHKNDKLKLKSFFNSPEIVSYENGKETVFHKDSIFAIKLMNGKNYRFVNHFPVLIADTSFLFIYANETTKLVFRQSGPRTRKTEVPVTYYYFSFGNHKAIYSLNLPNFKRYVLTDSGIYETISKNFPDDESLIEHDPQSGVFAINKELAALSKK